MQLNPYASPKANVAAPRSGPSEWQRAKWLFGGLWVLLTVLPIVNAVLEAPAAPDGTVLLLNSALAIALAVLVGREMWQLRVRHLPLIVDVAGYALALGGLGFLIVVKETGIYIWNDLHLDIPVFLLMGIVAIAAWVTESRKRVRIYVAARHLVFVGEE